MLSHDEMNNSNASSKTKPIASLSLDLDNKWSYMKTHGDAGWETFPSYLDILIPRALDFLKERNLKITFFVVGQDAALVKNLEALAQLGAAGHEIGNHSLHHEPWLHLYAEQEIEEQLAAAEEHIERATGRRPLGFRGPGFSFSQATLRVLARRGYQYDASTFPTYMGPLARAYYLMTAKLSKEERERRNELFGKLSDGRRPLKPYRWQIDTATLIEIPVTTMPLFKLPIHASYILYLGMFSKATAIRYFQTAINLCRMTHTQPSLLLHPLDFLSSDDTQDLSFFPAMKMPLAKKLDIISRVLGMMTSHFEVVTLQQHARAAAQAPDLNIVESSTLGISRMNNMEMGS